MKGFAIKYRSHAGDLSIRIIKAESQLEAIRQIHDCKTISWIKTHAEYFYQRKKIELNKERKSKRPIGKKKPAAKVYTQATAKEYLKKIKQ